MKKVSKDEYLEFLENYPNPIDSDYTGICMPPQLMHWDFSKNVDKCIAKRQDILDIPTYKLIGYDYYIMDDQI